MDFGLIVPCFMENDLLGFMVLGSKQNNQMYTTDDILIFESLSYSVSLAIENCMFWMEVENRQRLARIQEIDAYSYSLAHEIDNPIQVILGQSSFLKKELLSDIVDAEKRKNAEESFAFIKEAADRIAGMVKAIRDFGQKVNGKLKPLTIESVIDSFSLLYMPQFKNNGITFEQEIDAELGFVRGQKAELMQVLVILANNSIHAMKYSDEKKIILKVKSHNKDFVLISFSDTGTGILNPFQQVMFYPFTTTKSSSEGTGMGLYNAKKIIEKHNGKIWMESEEKKGTSFFIKLPVANDIVQGEDDSLDDKRMY
jgi:signal transduction histidine kinase